MADIDEKEYELEDQFEVGRRPTLLEDLERQELPGLNDNDIPPQRNLAKTNKSTAFLDGLRGVAALCVFNQHFIGGGDHERGFGNGYYYTISLPFVRTFYNGGSAAVSIFFVLSGFVLSQSSVKLFQKGQRLNCRRTLISAVIRRPFRLYLPCLGVVLITALAMHLPNGIYPDLNWSKAEPSIPAEILKAIPAFAKFFNPFQVHGSDQFWFPYNLVLWTIPIELKGSMLIYALSAVFCLGFGLRPWTVGLLSLMGIITLQIGWYSGACFIFGFVLTIVDLYALDSWYIFRHISDRTRTVGLYATFLVGYYLLSQPAVAGHPEWSLDTPGWNLLTTYTPAVYNKDQYYRFWQSYGAWLFVYATLRLPILQSIFGSRPLRYLGKVSFMLYLVHLPCMYVFGERFVRAFGQIGLGAEDKWWDNILWLPDWGVEGFNLRWIVNWSIMLAISLAFSHVATRFIDDPSVRIGKKISQKLGLELPVRSRRADGLENGRALGM